MLKNIMVFFAILLMLGGCSSDKYDTPEQAALRAFRYTVENECYSVINSNKIVSFILVLYQDKVEQMCSCVTKDAFNYVTIEQLLNVADDREARQQIAREAAAKTVLVCSNKLGFIK